MKREEQLLKNKFKNMRDRCYYPCSKSYKWYGAKGVTICQEWLDNPNSFIEWSLKNGYVEGLTIERLDTSKGYSPDNCCYIPMSEQPKNTCRNVFIDYNGETLIISEVARRENVSVEAIRKRLKRNKYKRVDNPHCIKIG